MIPAAPAPWHREPLPSPALLPDQVARRLVSRITGLCPSMRLHHFQERSPFHHVQAYHSNHLVFDRPARIESAGGSGFSLEEARTACLFEAVERYGASASEDHPTLWAAAELRPAFLYGERLPLFAPRQYERPNFPYQRPCAGAELRWVEMRSLASGKLRLYPASLVFLPFALRSRAEALAPCTSNGLAAGVSWIRACLSGLLEVCERDALMIAWFNRLSRPRLRVSSTSPLGGHLARVADLFPGSETTFVDLTNDFEVPVVLAVHRATWRGRPLVSIGTSARTSLEQAAGKALLEALAGYQRLVEELSGASAAWRPRPDFANVTEFVHHGLVYGFAEHQQHLAFLTASPEERSMDDGPSLPVEADAALEETVRRVAAAGEDSMAVPLTSPDLATLGVHVVKVVVPGAVAVSPDHRFPFLGSPRIQEVPVRQGWRSRPAAPEELNIGVPHPLA